MKKIFAALAALFVLLFGPSAEAGSPPPGASVQWGQDAGLGTAQNVYILTNPATNAWAPIGAFNSTTNTFTPLASNVQCVNLPTLTGDVTNVGCATTISSNAVTYSKFQQVSASKLLGNPTGSTANVSEISLGSTLTFSGSALQTGAGTGDVTWGANSFATTVGKVNGVAYPASPSATQVCVTTSSSACAYQNAYITINGTQCTLAGTCTVTASAALVGGTTTITGTCTSGYVLYNNAGVLACGAYTGTVTSVATGGGTTGGPITGAGTIYLEQMQPGGRLTVASGVCNPTTDQVAQTTLYYAPGCGGNRYVPIYNGTNMQLYPFTSSLTDTVGQSLVLGSNWTASTLYDVFEAYNSGTPVLCTGPAWSNSGAGTSARNAALALYDAYYTNAASMTCRTSNSTTITAPQYQATYLGTVLINASGGAIDLKFGTAAANCGAAVLSIYNQYNQLPQRAWVEDTTASWTYTAATWREAHGSTTCSITVVEGQTSAAISATYQDRALPAVSTGGVSVSIGLNNTTAIAARATWAIYVGLGSGYGAGSVLTSLMNDTLPLGLNTINAIEYSDGTNANSFYGANNQMQLTFNGFM